MTGHRAVACALLALAPLSGCGAGPSAGAPAQGSHGPLAGATRAPAAAGSSGAAQPSCAPSARTVCVVAAQGGRTVAARVGWTVTLALHAPGRVFAAPTRSGANVLRALAPARLLGGAVQVSYRAIAPGRALLRAAERPLCRAHRACPQFIALWQVTVLVSASRRP